MSNAQKQDLTVFDDHSVISEALFSEGSHNMLSFASAPVTSPFWLINAIVEDLTLGMAFSLNSNTRSTAASGKTRCVIIVTFAHNAKYYINAFSKLKIPKSSYQIVDLFTDFIAKYLGKPNHEILSEIVNLITNDASSVVLLETPEILLSLLDGLTSDDLHLKLINPAMRRCSLLLVATALRPTNEDNKDANEASRFTTCIFYKSIAVLSLRPLDTGRANDVTGSLRITRGGAMSTHVGCHVVENEYLYLVQKENTRLFYR